MTLRQSWLAVLHGWRIIGAVTVLGLVAGLLLGLTTERTYISHARLFVAASAEAKDADELYYRNLIAGQRIASYLELATGDAVDASAREKLAGGEYADATADVTATNIPSTVIIDLQAISSSPEAAQAVVAAYAESLPEVVTEVEQLEGGAMAVPVALTIVDEASMGTPASPSALRNALLGLLLGLVLGAVFCVLREAVRQPGRRADQLSV